MGTRIEQTNNVALDQKIRFYAKKKQFNYAERDEKKREEFQEQLSTKQAADLVFIDETGIDDNEVNRYAYAEKGTRAFSTKKALRKKRVSVISGLNNNKFCAPLFFEGTCTRQVFETYLVENLVKVLRPGMTIVMDNASIHKGGSIAKIIADAGCHLLYLPTYSPDLNPIEHHWAPLKYRFRNILQYQTRDLFDAAIIAFNNVST
jgi:transposase